MALLHRADLRPTKLELLASWLPSRSWYQGDSAAELVRVAAYRFDDPAGEVGIETLLVRFGTGPVHQVPLTYRGAPLPAADAWLIGTLEHSVLGTRWVYDACADPVYAAALADAVLTGSGQAEEYFEVDGRPEVRAPSMDITSDGAGADVPAVGAVRRVVDGDRTVIVTDTVELTLARRPGLTGSQPTGPAGATLTGTWDGVSAPLAYATLR
ncbi:hypothetical protein E0H26_02160 [Micromonospora zingiberis]|uniref:Maltokinase N-terminal cap domain-containing protein n=1 Tax=Micromonospora zingiberis TaxID=2053011 RepID=A0A4R0GWT2_9ACTN|nr:hypothetical protein [Micromonospora zingiberis]TCC00510.1 hypothetical protein E0H26_02160 [Micromonospora zingiberis]